MPFARTIEDEVTGSTTSPTVLDLAPRPTPGSSRPAIRQFERATRHHDAKQVAGQIILAEGEGRKWRVIVDRHPPQPFAVVSADVGVASERPPPGLFRSTTTPLICAGPDAVKLK